MKIKDCLIIKKSLIKGRFEPVKSQVNYDLLLMKYNLASLPHDYILTTTDWKIISGSYWDYIKYNDITPDFEMYVYSSSIILNLCKLYDETKQLLLNNSIINSDYKLYELSQQLKNISLQNSELSCSNHLLEIDNNKQQEKILNLEREITRLKKENEKRLENQNELVALREFMFNSTREDIQYFTEENLDNIDLKSKNIIYIGGHVKLQAKLKELYEIRCIGTDQMNYETSILQNCDLVCFHTSYLSHSLYYKTIAALANINVPLLYINNNNISMIIEQIRHTLI